ncbi:MAG TPA: hypothetical protein DCL21_01125 [Alphaproteobacteria bacterium]|nr:hypothetical protein [Alphaproteobacteria bacterium]
MLKRIFYLYSIALPIAVQSLIVSSKSFVDTYLLTLSSFESVSAVGIASKIFLVAFIILSGISTGASYVMSHNSESVKCISYSSKFTLRFGCGAAILIIILVYYIKDYILLFSSGNKSILSLSSSYIDIVLPSLIFISVTLTLSSLIRIKGDYRTPSVISIVSVFINITLSFVLIYNFKLGVIGAAYGTVISSLIECLIILYISYRRFFDLFRMKCYKPGLMSRICKQAFFSSSSGIVWAVGASAFYILLGSRDQEVLYIMSIISPIEAVVLSFTIGLSVSTGIEIGKDIPNRSNDYIFEDAKISIISSFLMSFLISMLLLMSKDLIFKSFGFNQLIIDADMFFYIMTFSIFIKSLSIQLMNGVIRAGGDGLFCLRCDFIFQWLFTLPLVLYLNSISMSVVYIYSIVVIEELLKLILCIFQFNSGKWLQNLAA